MSEPTAPYTVPNAPQPPIESTTGHVFDFLPGSQDGKAGTWRVDRRDGSREFYPNETISSRSGGSGHQSVFEQKQAAYLAVHPGDAQGALDYANGRRQLSEPEIAKASLALATREISNNMQLKFGNQAQQTNAINARAIEIAKQIRTGFGQPAPAAAPPAAPAPTPPARTPAPVTPGTPAAAAPMSGNPDFRARQLARAREAIAAGADAEQVKARLVAAGIDPSGL